MIEGILICPRTKNPIIVDVENNVARVKGSDFFYPISAGIIDFLPEIEDRISKGYDSLAVSYDDYANLSSLKWKLLTLFFAGFLDDKGFFTEKVLSTIPDDFEGVLLDVPVGTGIYTFGKYKKLKNASIIAIDYSFGMLNKAQRLFAEHGIENVTFIRGDVSCLPIESASVDLCLSMAGFHAFGEKEQSLSELSRVLKIDKVFTGSFYIRGKRLLTDLIARHLLTRRGHFTRPFYTENEALAKFSEYFNIEYSATMKSGFIFTMTKKSCPIVSQK